MSHSTSKRINLNRRRFLGVASTSLAVAGFAHSSTKSHLPIEGDFPSLSGAAAWIHSAALMPAALRGRVVLLNFCTYTCINWLRSLPYVRAWAAKYKDQGLAVIGVHTPEFAFEKEIDNVRRALADRCLDYPIAIDNDHAIWRAFGNQYWPALYFIDARGRIRHHQFGEGSYARSEIVIQELLRDAGATGVDGQLAAVDARGIEAPADWGSLQSFENYLGSERTENFVSSRRDGVYLAPKRLKLNQWAVAGDWTMGKQAIILNKPYGSIAYRFHAQDLHVVMKPAMQGEAARFRISLDGQPPTLASGLNVDSKGCGVVAEPKLYQLLRQPKPITDRLFKIEFLDRGVEAVSFTFG